MYVKELTTESSKICVKQPLKKWGSVVKLISFLIGFHYRQGLKTTTKYEVKRNEKDKDESI